MMHLNNIHTLAVIVLWSTITIATTSLVSAKHHDHHHHDASTKRRHSAKHHIRASNIRALNEQKKSPKLVIEETKLKHLMHDEPSVSHYHPLSNPSSSSSSSPLAHSQEFILDVISIGSESRLDYLTAQHDTWASNNNANAASSSNDESTRNSKDENARDTNKKEVHVRNFWGFTELQDLDSDCSSASVAKDNDKAHVEMCKSSGLGYVSAIEQYVNQNYGKIEGHGMSSSKDRSMEQGWICAQRRIGRALAHLQSQYSQGMELPDVVALVEDDTYLNLEEVKKYMIEDINSSDKSMREMYERPFALGGCVVKPSESDHSAITFPYGLGGFGTFLSKGALQKLGEPINCVVGGSIHKGACHALKENRIGESNIYEKGMSTLELFYKYTAIQKYCFHSDWLLGYMIQHYLFDDNLTEDDKDGHSRHEDAGLRGVNTHPNCGNFTSTGSIRPCTMDSMACHGQTPEDMKRLSSFAKKNAREDLVDTTVTKKDHPTQEKRKVEVVSRIEEHNKSSSSFPPIYWINLDRSTDRRQAMQDMFSSLGISHNTHRVSASDVTITTALYKSNQLIFHPEISLQQSTEQPEVPTWKKHTEGIYYFSEAACLLSHLNAIKQAYMDGNEYALIFEDDAMLSAVFRDTLMTYVKSQAPLDWKVLQFATNNAGVILQGALLNEGFVSWQPYHFSTRAYLVNRAGMQTLMKKAHSMNNEGKDVWSIQPPYPMVVADEVIYALIGDSYTSSGLWVDALNFDSVVQSESRSDFVSSEVSSSSYSAAGDMSKQVAKKMAPHILDQSLLVLMSVRIASEEDVTSQLSWILQDTHAVCKFHPEGKCQWEINLVVTTPELMELFQEVSKSKVPSHVHIHTTINPNKFNKFLFIRDLVDKFQDFDLLLFKDNDQRINGFPWHTFVEQRGDAIMAGPLRATTGENFVASLTKTKSQWFQFHEAKQWVTSKTDWGPKHFASLQPIDVPFLEMYFVLLQPTFASHFFKSFLTDDTVGQASNWGVDAIWCQAAAEWSNLTRPGCRFIPVVSVHEDGRQIVKDKKHYDSGAKAVEIIQNNPTFGKWMDTSTGWRELVGRRRTLVQIEETSATVDFFDVQACTNVLRVMPPPSVVGTSDSKKAEKFAYATVLGKNPDENQNQVYLKATRSLVRSLKRSRTKADIIILMMYCDSEVEQTLITDGAIVQHIRPIKQARAVENVEPWFADIALAKLRAFQLTDYTRVQLLDSDSMAFEGGKKNLDHMFHYSPTAKLVSEGLSQDSPLSAGYLLLKPSIDDFRELEAIVHRGKYDQYCGWDYLDLPVEYPGWSSHNPKEKWDFNGSQLEQGVYATVETFVVCIL